MLLMEKSLDGFSLLEVALGLTVIGVLAAGALKGYGLLKQARLYKTVQQIQGARIACMMFKERFGFLPGDAPEEILLEAMQSGVGQLRGGNGDGLIDGNPLTPWSEASLFWCHLKTAGFLKDIRFSQKQEGIFVPQTASGSGLFVMSNPPGIGYGNWFVIASMAGADKAILTPEAAQGLDKKFSNGNPLEGTMQSRDAPGSEQQSCVKEGRYNLDTQRPCCLVYVAIDNGA